MSIEEISADIQPSPPEPIAPSVRPPTTEPTPEPAPVEDDSGKMLDIYV